MVDTQIHDPLDVLRRHPSLSDYSRDGNCYRFKLGGLPQRITVRLVRRRGGVVRYELSHYIKTPLQPDRYMPAGGGRDEYQALLDAVYNFAHWYDATVEAGHDPQPSWLIPNPAFR